MGRLLWSRAECGPRTFVPKDTIRRWVNGEPYEAHDLVAELDEALTYFGGDSLHSWQQTAEASERENAELRGAVDAARDTLAAVRPVPDYPEVKTGRPRLRRANL